VCADGAVTKFRGDVQAYKVCGYISSAESGINYVVTMIEHHRKQYQSTAVIIFRVIWSMLISMLDCN